MTYLAQYGIHRGNVRGVTMWGDSEPGVFSSSSVRAFINGLLDAGKLPEPDEEWPIIDAVMILVNSAFAEPLRRMY